MTSHEQKLQQLHLEGFFKWRIEKKIRKSVKEIQNTLLRWGEEDPNVKILSVLLLGFIKMKGTAMESNAVDCEEAKSFIDQALFLSTNNNSCLFLAHSLLAHWHSRMEEQNGFEVHFTKAKGLLETIENKPDQKAWLFAAHGFALLQSGPTEFDMVIQLLDKAIERNSEEPLFYYLKGLTLGRKRRYLNERSVPTDSEILCLETASNKTNNKNLNYLSTYCFCLAEKWSIKSSEGKDKIKGFLRDAEEASNAYVLLQCAKSYRLLKEFPKQKELLEKANNISSGTYSAVLHQLGLYFWRNNINRDMDKAEKYLEKSFSVDAGENIVANVDYLKLLKEKHKIDSNGYLARLVNIQECPSLTDINRAYLCMCKGEEKMLQKNVDDARRCFWQAITLDPELCDVRNAKTKLLKILEERISNNPEDDHALCELGKLYETLRPQDITKAINHYKKVLSLNADDKEANLGLCRVMLAKYDKKLCLSEFSEINERLSRFKDHFEFRKLSGKCLYFWGLLLFPDNIADAKKILIESVKLGCMDSCKPLLSLLNNFDYTESAVILNYSVNEEAYWLDDQWKMTNDEIEKDVKKSLGIVDHSCSTNILSELSKIRKLRLEMEKAAMSQTYYREQASAILSETKNLLDRTMNQFENIFYKGTHEKRSTYFPYLQPSEVTNHPSGSEQDLSTCRRLMVEKKFKSSLKHWVRHPPGKGNVEPFYKEFGNHFEILCKYQAPYDERFYFVPKWMEVRNEQTHVKINNQNEFTLGNGSTVTFLDLARKAHEYTENVVKEFNSILPP